MRTVRFTHPLYKEGTQPATPLTPHPEWPSDSPVDPLSDVLRAVRLTGAYFYIVEGARSWSVATRPAQQLAPRILPEAEHLVPYHILSEGTCWGGLHGQ